MSQWFNGIGPLTPSSPTQAATLIIEGVIKEHEGNNPPKRSETASAEQVVNVASWKSAYPLIHTTATGTVCNICFFPVGVHREFFKCYRLHRHEFLAEEGLVAFAFSETRDEQSSEPRIEVYENGIKMGGARIKEKVNCIGLESRDRITLGHEGHVDVYDRQKTGYTKTEVMRLRGHSPVVTKFSGEVLLIGTALGGVFGYNMRKGQFSWTFQAEGRGRVYDLQMKKGIVYVCGGGGLWMWDMRGTDKVRRQFGGHRNRGKKTLFDTNTELGLLAAGGDDGVVRLWNCRSGEDPMADLKMAGEVPVAVKFVYDRLGGEETVGLWIATKRKLYTCVVEPNALLESQ